MSKDDDYYFYDNSRAKYRKISKEGAEMATGGKLPRGKRYKRVPGGVVFDELPDDRYEVEERKQDVNKIKNYRTKSGELDIKKLVF